MALGAVREDEGGWPLDDVLLLLDGLSQRLSEGHLGKVLQCSVDSVPDGVIEYALHPAHQHLQAFDHGDHLEGHSFQWLKGDRGQSFTAWEVSFSLTHLPWLPSLPVPGCPVPSPSALQQKTLYALCLPGTDLTSSHHEYPEGSSIWFKNALSIRPIPDAFQCGSTHSKGKYERDSERKKKLQQFVY